MSSVPGLPTLPEETVVKRRPRRAAYALPTLFTSGNIFLGFLAVLQAFEGALQARGGDFGSNPHFAIAAKALGIAVFFDGLDGRIARMTNTVSDFGRELDSMADVVTFGIAPAVLAFVWGVFFVISPEGSQLLSHLIRAGYVVVFFYLLCGAVRLARFNVQTNPKPKNPGRPDRKYFVGMPIPAGAGVLAAVVHSEAGSPVHEVWASVAWIALVAFTGFLMVSSWRFWSGKEIDFSSRRPGRLLVLLMVLLAVVFEWHRYALIVIAMAYLVSGVFARLAYSWKRRSARTA